MINPQHRVNKLHTNFLALSDSNNKNVTIVNNPTVSIIISGNVTPEIIKIPAATILPTKFPNEYNGVNTKDILIVLHLPNLTVQYYHIPLLIFV
jgi:hypothetical protein